MSTEATRKSSRLAGKAQTTARTKRKQKKQAKTAKNKKKAASAKKVPTGGSQGGKKVARTKGELEVQLEEMKKQMEEKQNEWERERQANKNEMEELEKQLENTQKESEKQEREVTSSESEDSDEIVEQTKQNTKKKKKKQKKRRKKKGGESAGKKKKRREAQQYFSDSETGSSSDVESDSEESVKEDRRRYIKTSVGNTRSEFKAQAAAIRKKVEKEFGHKKEPFVAFVEKQEKTIKHGEKRAYYEARDMAVAADAVLYESIRNWESSALKVINEKMAAALFQAHHGFEARKAVAPSKEDVFSPDLTTRAEKLARSSKPRVFDEWQMDREESSFAGESDLYDWRTSAMYSDQQEQTGWGQQPQRRRQQGTMPRGGFRGGFRGGYRGGHRGRGRRGHWNGYQY